MRLEGSAASAIQRRRRRHVSDTAGRRGADDRHASRRCEQPQRTQRSQDRKDRVRDRPHVRLLRERQSRFEQRRIGEQAEEASCVGRGVEEVGIARCCVATLGEPALQDRARRADDEQAAGRH